MTVELAKIPEFNVKYSDVFNLRNLYTMMHEYLIEDGWRGTEKIFEGDTSSEHQDIEKLYLEKFCQKALHKGGKEMWVWWRLVKYPGGKPAGYSEYFEFQLDIDFHMVYMKDVDLMHQGKKIIVQKGELEIMFKPTLMGDIKDYWKKHPILKHFHKMYYKRVLSQEIEKKELQIQIFLLSELSVLLFRKGLLGAKDKLRNCYDLGKWYEKRTRYSDRQLLDKDKIAGEKDEIYPSISHQA